MQCPSCGFENIPGMANCVRCQTLLNLSDVSVVPGRASALNWNTRSTRARNTIRSALSIPRIGSPLARMAPRWGAAVPWDALVRSFVPGLGQLYEKHRWYGWILMSTWLLCLLAGLLTFPGRLSAWCITFAIVTQVVAVISLLRGHMLGRSPVAAALLGVLLFLGLRTFVYQPIGWLAGRWAQPLIVPDGLLKNPVLQPGDGVLVSGPRTQKTEFRRGDLVLYEVPQAIGYPVQIAVGHGIDRIVGIPGDTVEIRSGRILVNDQPPAAGEVPLGPLDRFPDRTLILERDQYLILPTRLGLVMALPKNQAGLLYRLCVVDRSAITGRIFYRLKPWSRFGPID